MNRRALAKATLSEPTQNSDGWIFSFDSRPETVLVQADGSGSYLCLLQLRLPRSQVEQSFLGKIKPRGEALEFTTVSKREGLRGTVRECVLEMLAG